MVDRALAVWLTSHMANTPPAARQVGEAVEAALVTAGQSINGLADATGIPFSTLRRKIKARADFTLGEVLLIAEALGVHPGALLPADFTAEQVA